MEIIFESKRFESVDGAIHNNMFFIESVSKFFLIELQKRNYRPKIIYTNQQAEIIIEKENINLYIYISVSLREVSSVEESMVIFVCHTGYSLTPKGKILKLLKKLSPENELLKLNWDIKNIISLNEIKIIKIKDD